MDDYLLEILRCPKTGGKLKFIETTKELVCQESRLAYPIIDGIPIMLIDRARKISEDEYED